MAALRHEGINTMARRRTQPESVHARWQLSTRMRTIRKEQFGERGTAEIARQIGIPNRSWYSYETGVTIPAEVMLRFVELTLVEPHWLLHGQGPKYRTPAPVNDAELQPGPAAESRGAATAPRQ